VYARIFDWLVNSINANLSNDTRTSFHIGVLDIFGFEHFKHNSFEQFCINYANEKLQQKFTSDVFKTVQLEYDEEGIAWEHIEFSDNQDVLNVIEDRIGIISMLNEELRKAKSSEQVFVSTISSINKDLYKSSVIEFPKTSRTEFTIKHYAAPVKYEAIGFLEKHKDTLLPDLSELMRASSMTFIQKLFEEQPPQNESMDVNRHPKQPPARRGQGSLAIQTVGTQFKDSLTELMTSIQGTKVQYVRCIKPNAIKSATEMDHSMVVSQLRCAGVIEAIRISRAAYPNRQTHEEFLAKFCLFVPPGPGTPRDKCEELMIKLKLEAPKQYQMGYTKIYFQLGVLEELENRRKVFLDKKAQFLQRIMRGFIQRIKYLRQYRAIVTLQSVIRCLVAMRRYNTFLRGLICLQARVRGAHGRKVATEVKLHHCAVVLRRYILGYSKCRMYKKKRRLVIRVQARVRMQIQRAKYVVALEEKKLEADMKYQLQKLQKQLQDQRETSQTSNADAGGMIGSLQASNAALKKENEELKAQVSTLKSELSMLQASKEFSSAGVVVKLKQEQEITKSQQKKIDALEKEIKKLKDAKGPDGMVVAGNHIANIGSATRRRIFRTLGAKKIDVKEKNKDGDVMLDSLTNEKDLNNHVGGNNSNNAPSQATAAISGLLAKVPHFKRSTFYRTSEHAVNGDSELGEKHSGFDSKTDSDSISRASVVGTMSGAMSGLKSRSIGIVKNLYSGAKVDEKTPTLEAQDSVTPMVQKKASGVKILQESFNLDSLPESPLPNGWEAKVSRSNGKVYYVNKSLHITQWDRPTIETLKLMRKAKKQQEANGAS
jgi:myosin-5